MRRRCALFAFACLLLVPAAAEAKPAWRGTLSHHTMPAGATYPSRDYYLYVPPSLPRAGARALVIYLHGCTQPALEAALGTRWNELADQRGFVVAYPDQHVPSGVSDAGDGNAARCWNPGQAEALPRGSGEIGTVAEITRRVMREQAVDPGRVYVAGISGGALMATTMAVVYPDLYAAVGHVANCGYSCADATGELAYRRMGEYARVVPAMVIQGTADFLINPAMGETAVTQWVGTNDRADDGQANGSVPRTPTSQELDVPDGAGPRPPGSWDVCAEDLTDHNPCPGGVLGPYPVAIRRYGDVVEAWNIVGISHNWSGGDREGSFTDPYGPNITPPLYDFFEKHARAADPPEPAAVPAPPAAPCRDAVAPRLRITHIRRTHRRILVRGTAVDRGCSGRVAGVMAAVGRGRFVPARGTAHWRITLHRRPGRVRVRAVDAAGNVATRTR